MKYGTVDNGIWHHPDFMTLSDNAKLLFLHLKTNDRMNMIGCYNMSIVVMSDNLGWDQNKGLQTVEELFASGFLKMDKGLKMVFLPKHLDKHPLQNLNQGKGAEKLFNEIPKRFKYIKELAEVLLNQQTLPKPFANRLQTLCNSVSVTGTETVTGTEDGENPPEPPKNDPRQKFRMNNEWTPTFDEMTETSLRKAGITNEEIQQQLPKYRLAMIDKSEERTQHMWNGGFKTSLMKYTQSQKTTPTHKSNVQKGIEHAQRR